MKDKQASLKRQWERILKRRSKHFVRLTCRTCGTRAHAASLEIADILGGWTRLKRLKEFDYTGVCIDCKNPPKEKRKKS